MKNNKELIVTVQTQKDFNKLPEKINGAIKEGYTDIRVDLTSTAPYYYEEKFLTLDGLQNPDVSISFTGPEGFATLRPTSVKLTDDKKTDVKPQDIYRSSFITVEENYPTAKKPGFFKKIWKKICYGFCKFMNKWKWTAKIYWKLHKPIKSVEYKPYYNSMWSPKFYTVSALIEVTNEKTKECRLIYDKLFEICDVNGDVKDKAWVHVLQWYKSNYYPITKIDLDNNCLYFTCTDLAFDSSKKTWSINNDYKFSKGQCLPMFRLANVGAEDTINVIDGIVYLPKYIRMVDATLATNFLTITKTELKNLSFKNITFEGSSCNSKVPTLSLISLDTVSAKDYIIFDHCEFFNIQSNCAIRTYKTKNVKIQHCSFIDGWQYGIFVNEGKNHIITHNNFRFMGLAKSNHCSIRIDCEDFDVSYNDIETYGYNAIATGTWWGTPDRTPNIGHIHGNTVLGGVKNENLLMDSGALYIYTQNTDVQIHDNIIIGHEGRKENRGIFCDDGAANYSVYWNYVQQGKPNSYSIDARRVQSVEVSPTTQLTSPANVNCKIFDNVVDGPIKFEGHEKYVGSKTEPEKRCLLGPNYGFGSRTSTDHPDSIMKNVDPLIESKGLVMFEDDDKWPEKAKDLCDFKKRFNLISNNISNAGAREKIALPNYLKSKNPGTDQKFIG